MRYSIPWLAACLAVTGADTALAETAQHAGSDLAATISDLKAATAHQKELARKNAALQRELKSLQREMVAMGKDNSRAEEDLTAAEEKLAALEKEKKDKTQALQSRRADLTGMISAMIKLKNLPPEAIIAMPGKLDETLETSRALSIVTHAVEEESQKLKAELDALDELGIKIHKDREAIVKRKAELAARQDELAAKLKERGALVAQLGGQERAQRERIARLSARSRSLQELVDTLKKTEYGWNARLAQPAPQEPEKPSAAWTPVQTETPEPESAEEEGEEETSEPHAAFDRGGKASRHRLRSFIAAEGQIRLPAVGRIVNRFGNMKYGSTFAKGITLETRPEAGVVAPFDGEVVFTGPFRDYGRMIIIRHADNYHTLLSGMEGIDCKPGQYLLEGEPIGTMGETGPHRLYMELREDGKPVDPVDWLRG